MFRLACAASVFLTLSLISGCTTPQNAPPPPIAAVKGKVTLDGQPMATGNIEFSVMGQPPKTAEIKDGAFSGEGYVGKNNISIVLLKEGPPSTTDPKIKTSINLVAPQYSGSTSTLHADVVKDGANEFKFEIKSN